jgi:hypothetical protein
MSCYGGISGVICEAGDGAAQRPHGVPPDQTNI